MANAQPCAERIYINLNAPPAFQLRQKVLGDNNANLHYIVQETKANVSLRGRGSGFIEQNGIESIDPMYLMIEHPALKNLIEAKTLAKNLIETIQQDLQMFIQPVQIQQQPPPIIQTSTQQISIPQSVLSCPPPTIIQQQNFIPQHQIISNNVPMQIIQQTPPPNSTRTGAPLVQLQGQAASLQPTNIQIQGANGQQYMLNQAPTQQYQLQYIPSTNQIANMPQLQTIQHLIQPQQQIQGILQPGANGQQYITVQGNTAFMIPPPNIIQQTAPQTAFNQQQTIQLSQEDNKNELLKMKQETDHKNGQNMQAMATRLVTNIPLNQPPPVLNCPPPQVFNNQQTTQQQIQQFIVNSNTWPQQQQIHQLPLNSQIQIVTQPHQVRNGNEIVIQNPVTQQGQQVIINPQGQQYQQIQFHQATISQPPPVQPQIQSIHSAPPNTQNISYQQQFEQKINNLQSTESQQQQRTVKRKFEGEKDLESSKSFAKIGIGNANERTSSPQNKGRMMGPNTQGSQPVTANFNVNNLGLDGDSSRNVQIQMFNRNVNQTNALLPHTSVATAVESNTNKSTVKIENESSEASEQYQSFMVRSGNQSYRFQGPQSFIHQQPPPISQSSQFSGPRGQIMSTSSMNLYQNAGQNQMLQPPPPVTTTHQFVHQDMNVYQQQQNNFHTNNQQGNRFSTPPQQQQQQNDANNGMMTGSYSQQPRFRQW